MPIDTAKLEKFDPLGVPTVIELLEEIDEWDASHKQNGEERGEEVKKIQDYEKTSLKPYIEYFRNHVSRLLKDGRGVKREREDDGDAMEF